MFEGFDRSSEQEESNSLIKEVGLAYRDSAVGFKNRLVYFFTHFSECMKAGWDKIRAWEKFDLLLVLTVCAFLCYAYTMLTNGFVVAVNGDYRLQGMAFIYNGYDDWHYFFKTGVFPMWDTSGALGVDNITGYSFYYLFDPFFLALLIWPRAWLSQMQAIFMIVKIVLSGLFMYDYLGSFHITKSTRKIGALAYAFCGWGWFYLWFFHMAEIVTFLPLMLWGVEKIIQKKDPRLFTVAAFLMGATNYQFLAIFMVFSFFYALFRYFHTFKERDKAGNWAVIGIGFVAFLTGILICCFIIIPSYLQIKSMPRISTSGTFLAQFQAANGVWAKISMCLFWPSTYSYRAIYPLESLLYFVDSCFSEPLMNLRGGYYDNAGSSLYVSTPLLLLIIPSLIDAFKQKQKGQIIAFVLLAIALECPVVYFAAGGFSAVPYGRWELFVVICLVTFVCLHLDNMKKMPRVYLDISFIIVSALLAMVTVFCFLIPEKYNYAHGLQALSESSGIISNVFIALAVFQALWYLFCYIFMRSLLYKRYFKKDLFYVIAFEAIIGGNIAVVGQGTVNYYSSALAGHDVFVEQTNIIEKLKDYDPDTFYRVLNTHVSSSSNFDPNLAMAEGYNGIGTFNSVINYESEDFFEWSRIDHNNDSYMLDYQEKRLNLDEFLGVKYYLVDADDVNIPYGFVDVTTLADCTSGLKSLLNSSSNPDGNYKLYKNTNFIDRAFAFDDYMLSSTITQTGCEADAEINYLKRAIVDQDYYDDNTALFEPFTYHSTSEGYISTGSYYKNSTYASKATYYESIWDSDIINLNGTSGDILRTLDSTLTDAEYSALHETELQADIDKEQTVAGYSSPYAFYSLSSRTRQDGGKIYYLKQNASTGFYSKGDVKTTNSLYFQGYKAYYSKFVLQSSADTPIIAPDAASHSGAYITLQTESAGASIAYYLYGKDEEGNYKLLTYDNSNYLHESSQKRARGFYVTEPVYKIVGLILTSNFSIHFYSSTMEYLDEFQSDVDKLQANTITVDTAHTDANTLTYSSDYASKKIVVLNTLYSKGFSLKKTYKDAYGNTVTSSVPLFKANGGLLGYVADAGTTDYVLSYYTAGLELGLKITWVGLAFQGALFIAFDYFTRLKREYDRLSKVTKFKSGL